MASSGPIELFEAPRDDGRRAAVLLEHFDAEHPRVRIGAHAHRDLELLYFTHGGGTHRLGGRLHTICEGEIHIIPAATPHDLSGLGPARGWALEFAPDAVPQLLGGASAISLWRSNPFLAPFLAAEEDDVRVLRVPGPERAIWTARLDQLAREREMRREGHEAAVLALLVLLLVELGRLAGNAVVGEHRTPVVGEVLTYIDAHFHEPLSLKDVADQLGFTPGYLTTLVRRRTGRTVLEWITERRMTEARRLLLETDDTNDEVARKVGYDDAAYFSRRFRQVHGRPPVQWRARSVR